MFDEFFSTDFFFGLVEDIFSKSCYHINPPLEVFLWPLPGNAAPGCEVSLLPVFFPAAVGLPSSCCLGGKAVLKLSQWGDHGRKVILLKSLLTLELLPQRLDGEHTDSVSVRGLYQQRQWKPGSRMRRDVFVNAHTRLPSREQSCTCSPRAGHTLIT